MASRVVNGAWAGAIILACTAVGAVASQKTAEPRDRSFDVVARKYAYDPPVIRLNQGDRVTLRIKSADVTHGFFLEGYDLDAKVSPEEKMLLRHPSQGQDYHPVDSIRFVANRAGKFRYRCSVTCGFMHPFMLGEMVVAPNRPFGAGIGASIGLMLAMLILAFRNGAVRDA